jgi:hypothetical protein
LAVASARSRGIVAAGDLEGGFVANKEQKRSSREAKKPKQKKKGSQKPTANKVQITKT